MGEYSFRFMYRIVSFSITLALSWVLLWAANIINYLLSLPVGGWISAIISAIAYGNPVVDFISLAITTGIAYFFAFGIVYHIYIWICGFMSDIFMIDDDYTWADRVLIIMLAVFIVIICDTRIHQFDITVLSDIITFFKDECYYKVLGVIDIFNENFGGTVSPMQFNVFDTAVIGSAIWISICP